MEFEKACKKVAKELNEDYKLVHDIAMYQFSFIKDVMNDPEDTHDILINKLFRFKLKPRFKVNKQQEYSPKYEDGKKDNKEV